VDPPDVFKKIIAETSIQWLDNRQIDIPLSQDKFSVIGLTCTHLPERDFATLNSYYLPDPANMNFLLYHSPDIAPLTCSAGFDLQLSGHTHGGQVRLPMLGALYAASLYGKKLESGRYLLKKMTLYVTRGLGMEGGIAPRVRLFCQPELIIWQITGTNKIQPPEYFRGLVGWFLEFFLISGST
jgi:predicted MPP superfamily phosphohydrolase